MNDIPKYTVHIEAAQAGEAGAIEIQALLDRPLAQQTTLRSPTGQDILIPDGNIHQHLLNRLSEFGGMTGFVKIVMVPATPPAKVAPIEVPIPARSGTPYTQAEIMEIARQELIRQGVPMTVTIPSTTGGTTDQPSEAVDTNC